METITNAATSVVNTASSLIYGQPAKDNTATDTKTSNETGGQEPISGQQGKGTVDEPFDQGNAENPVDTTSKTNTASATSADATSNTGSTSHKDEFLTLSPAVGQPTASESSSHTNTGATGETSIPIVPLNPDVATMGGGKTNAASSSETGITDKAGVTDQVWKPTALDEVKPEGAPGAGPSAPEYTPATPDQGASTSNKATESVVKDASKDLTSSENTQSSSQPKKESVGGDFDAILGSTPKSKHAIDDAEANDPHSKMADKTVRQTEASQHGETEGSKSLVSEKAGTRSESNTSADAGEEKSGKKISHLKEKLKDKLHIGSKDK